MTTNVPYQSRSNINPIRRYRGSTGQSENGNDSSKKVKLIDKLKEEPNNKSISSELWKEINLNVKLFDIDFNVASYKLIQYVINDDLCGFLTSTASVYGSKKDIDFDKILISQVAILYGSYEILSYLKSENKLKFELQDQRIVTFIISSIALYDNINLTVQVTNLIYELVESTENTLKIQQDTFLRVLKYVTDHDIKRFLINSFLEPALPVEARNLSSTELYRSQRFMEAKYFADASRYLSDAYVDLIGPKNIEFILNYIENHNYGNKEWTILKNADLDLSLRTAIAAYLDRKDKKEFIDLIRNNFHKIVTPRTFDIYSQVTAVDTKKHMKFCIDQMSTTNFLKVLRFISHVERPLSPSMSVYYVKKYIDMQTSGISYTLSVTNDLPVLFKLVTLTNCSDFSEEIFIKLRKLLFGLKEQKDLDDLSSLVMEIKGLDRK